VKFETRNVARAVAKAVVKLRTAHCAPAPVLTTSRNHRARATTGQHSLIQVKRF
jgi:hypothetical protein